MVKLATALGVLAVCGATVPIAAQAGTTYSALNDFSQSSSIWSYGYGATGTSFTPFAYYYTNDSSNSCYVSGDSVTCGEISPGGLPEVAKITGTEVDSGTDVLVTDALYMHPGPSDDAIVKFTAPAASTYTVSGFFETLDTNPQPAGVKLTVIAGSTSELATVLSGEPASFPGKVGGNVPFSFSTYLTADQTILFGVNDNGSFGNNGTGFDATITAVPEPATWALVLIGFGGLGATLRASRRKVVAG